MSRIYTIVGIDPGTTVGIAVLGLDGSLLGLFSSKEMSVNSIVENIMGYGVPSVVATDVSTVPQTVEKIAVSLGAKIYSPPVPILVKEKNEMAKRYPQIKNAHERDSLSAALKAHQSYANKFDNVDSRLRGLGLTGISDEVKALVVKDRTVSSAIDMLTGVKVENNFNGGPNVGARPRSEEETEIVELGNRIERQRAYIVEQDEEIRSLGKRIDDLEKRLEQYDHAARVEATKSKLVASKNSLVKKQQTDMMELKRENSFLKGIIKDLREIRLLQLKDKVIVCKVLDNFNKTSICELDKRFGIKRGDVIFINDCSGGGTSSAHILCEKEVRAIIHGSEMSHTARGILDRCGVALIDLNSVPVKTHEDYGMVDKGNFELEYELWKERHEKSMKQEGDEWLSGLINEYRYERKKKIK